MSRAMILPHRRPVIRLDHPSSTSIANARALLERRRGPILLVGVAGVGGRLSLAASFHQDVSLIFQSIQVSERPKKGGIHQR